MAMIADGLENGVTPEALEKLVALQERIDAREAERAFNEAMAEFQSRVPTLSHDSKADTGRYSYTFSSLAGIVTTIQPLLRECGLTYSWDSNTDGGSVCVTCTVRHVAGHSKSATFTAPIDSGARMNVMQQGASALSYARRYALQLALGLVTADTDNDAATVTSASSGTQTVTSDELKRLAAAVKHRGLDPGKWIWQIIGLPKDKAQRASNWNPEDMARCWEALDGLPDNSASGFTKRLQQCQNATAINELFEEAGRILSSAELDQFNEACQGRFAAVERA